MEFYQEVERSLITTYRKRIWSPFTKAVRDYQLIQPGDKIAVCISGGKDSMLLAKLIQELQKHGPVNFEAIYLCMDPGYADENRKLLLENARRLHVPLQMFDSPIFDVVVGVDKNPCYLCARMRRGYLYCKAQELGCNKIALGHHFSDMIETVVMGMLYGGQIQTMMPKLYSTHFPGMELIRPLYMVHEDDIIAWSSHHSLRFLQCACKFTAQSKHNEMLSKRKTVKGMIREWKKTNPQVEQNIFKSVHSVNLNTILGYKTDDSEYFFLDDYEERNPLKTQKKSDVPLPCRISPKNK